MAPPCGAMTSYSKEVSSAVVVVVVGAVGADDVADFDGADEVEERLAAAATVEKAAARRRSIVVVDGGGGPTAARVDEGVELTFWCGILHGRKMHLPPTRRLVVSALVLICEALDAAVVAVLEVDQAEELEGADVYDVGEEGEAGDGAEEGEAEGEREEDEVVPSAEVQRRPQKAPDEAARGVAEALSQHKGVEGLLGVGIAFDERMEVQCATQTHSEYATNTTCVCRGRGSSAARHVKSAAARSSAKTMVCGVNVTPTRCQKLACNVESTNVTVHTPKSADGSNFKSSA